MEVPQHPDASHYLPPFITAPGQTDWLFNVMAIVVILAVLGIGVFFFWLHSLPERMVHNKAQFDLVAVLALLSLFTHIHAFWVAALIIALIEFPQFSWPEFSNSFKRIAGSLETMADAATKSGGEKPSLPPGPKSVPNAQSKADSPSSAPHNEPALKRGGSGHA